MTMRVLVNVGLLGFALVLVLLVYFEPGVERKQDQPQLTSVRSADVERIFMRQPGGDELVIAKRDGFWMIESPINVYANEFRIDPLLRVTETSSYASFEVTHQDLGKYRLDPPLAVLRVNDIEIAFGGTEPINNRRYVKVGNFVHLIDDHYYFRLQSDLPAFVSNQLLPPDRPVRIALPAFTLARDQEGRWTVHPGTEATPDALNTLVDMWTRAQAIEVERDEGNRTQGLITVAFETGATPIEFRIVESEPDLILARADLGLRYRLTAEQAHRLLSLPDATPADEPAR